MRILGGRWKGTELTSPGGRVRPTSEEVRSVWLDGLRVQIPDARVLDLFAGTGALGLEALSRKASSCDFVENGPSALHSLKANVAKVRARRETRIFKRDALAFAAGLEAGAYEIAFADPPYESTQLDRLIEIWLATPFSAVLTVEHSANHEIPGRPQVRRIGDTLISTFRRVE